MAVEKSKLETVHAGGHGDAALPELHAEGVFLLGVDVELAELVGNLDAHKLIAAGGRDLHADQLPAVGRPLEFLVDLALDDILVAAQAVAVFEQFIDAQLGDIAERSGFFADQGWFVPASENELIT